MKFTKTFHFEQSVDDIYLAYTNEDFLLKKINELEKQLIDKNNEISLLRQSIEGNNNKLTVLIEKMNKELAALHGLQAKLVPTEFPTIPGFEFSSKFESGLKEGGDYFDIISNSDKSKFSILVASCSSYIVSALLMATIMRKINQLKSHAGSDPAKVILGVIEKLQDGLEDKQSIDLFYGIFDRKQFKLNYISLGNIFGVHQKQDRGNLKLLDTNLGSLEKTSHFAIETKEVRLNPRDRLVFITKGGQAVKNTIGEKLGSEGLMKSLLSAPESGAHELRNYLAYSIKKYNVNELIYFEEFVDNKEARKRERQLKNWHKEWKWNLIKETNPNLETIEIN